MQFFAEKLEVLQEDLCLIYVKIRVHTDLGVVIALLLSATSDLAHDLCELLNRSNDYTTVIVAARCSAPNLGIGGVTPTMNLKMAA